MDEEKLIEVGEFYSKLNEVVGTNLPLKEIYRSKGLPIHLVKQKHFNCLEYIDSIPDIINEPDYIGVNPNKDGNTIELIKVLNKNILVGIKLDADKDYFYIATMHDVQESKLQRRLHSVRGELYN